MTKSIVLLKTMMAATSRINVIKHSQDKKRKNTAIGTLIGYGIGGLLGMALIGAMAFGMSYYGFSKMVPDLVATALSAVALILTLFKSNGYLYAFKEYDMLMAMPFSVRTIVSDRFLLMYLQNLPLNMLISVSALIGYAVVVHPGVWVYVSWIVMTPFIPLLPTVVVSLLGVLVADIGSRFKHKKVIQIVLTFILLIPLVFSRFIINSIIQNNQLKELMSQSSQALSGVSKAVPTVGWFDKAINDTDILSFVLVIAVSLAVYIAFILIISATYRRINSALENSAAKRKGRRTSVNFNKKSIVQSIAYNEYRRISGSTTCAVNLGFGAVIAVIVGVILPFINVNSLVSLMAKGASVDLSKFHLVWPVVVFFFIGMLPTTAPSPSLEGKSNWILDSLPISKMDIIKGKMRFNLYMNLIPGLFVVTTGMIALRAEWWEYLMGLVMITAMAMFSTTRGMKCGLKHVDYNWENEIEVVKKGAAVTTYLLPNMFITMILMGLIGLFSYFLNSLLAGVIVTVVYGGLAVLYYMIVKKKYGD